MALTNFGTLLNEQKTVWSRDVWKMARNSSFLQQFAGSGFNSMVTRVTELTKDERGTRAVVHLVTDLEGDGVMGDTKLEDSEEEVKAYDKVIQIDQMRNANRNAGRMAEQGTVIRFREQSKDVLGYWLGDRTDQLGFLTLSGIGYGFKNNGAQRYAVDPGTGKKFTELDFAADVSAPTAKRVYRWDNATKRLIAGDGRAAMVAADTPSYEALVNIKATAKDQYMRGVRGGTGEIFHCFLPPQGLARLKLDPDFIANVRHAMPRSSKNPLFAGSESYMVDGMMIHEYRHVFNTLGAAAGTNVNVSQDYYKWGANADQDGFRMLFCGAQALALADIGAPMWEEDTFDYKNQNGISIAKIQGFLKPSFQSIYTGSVEDLGVMCVDFAM